MSDYNYDFSQPITDLVPDGTYEAVLKTAEIRVSKSGNKYISLEFVIRDDVDQLGKNSHIFDSVFSDKNHAGAFDLQKLGKIVSTQAGQPGYTTSFESTDDVLQYINGINLKITVSHREDPGYEPKNVIVRNGFAPSAATKALGAAPQQKAVVGNNPPVDEDMPF